MIKNATFSDQISMEVSLVFEDVSDEYSQIAMILDRFEEWRKNDFDTYKDTYFSLCLPKVWHEREHLIYYTKKSRHLVLVSA